MTAVSAAPATETQVPTDDGALLAVSVLAPLAPATGTTVLLAHGWGASRRVWSTVADRLIRCGHRVVTYDQRGHGASSQGREPFGIARLGADLAAVLDQVAAADTLVVGHSGGGFAALSYASSYASGAGPAGPLGGLVLLGTAAHDQDTPDGEVRMMGSALFQRAVSRPALGRKLLGQNMLGPGADRQLREVNRQMFAATSPAVRAEAFRSSRGMDLREALVSVTAPTVVLAGARDKVVPPRLGRVVAEALPRARFEELPDAGHMLPLEAPGAVVSAVHELTQGRS
ncbi:alpha/beta hydrolase [Streptomyces sp. SID10853]|uniref:alpha/beta fold hydrolase n=1 Tax=Streptomyces sp. SID10853 TaxID=2706028 RepID=UPI0013C1B3E3|nr:alpha/beta hydrolase [Streptomyces sp. SID10853]NDZ80123.1 alpha/beta hydrolase [Streptomyces sp. SID10853]